MLVQRALAGGATLAVVLTVVFVALEALPGDACTAYLERDAKGEMLRECRRDLGLDRPVWTRFAQWAAGLAAGDLGVSLVRDRPVAEILAPRIRNTFVLVGFAALLAVPIAILAGTAAALRRDGPFDLTVSAVVLIGMAVPEFVIATVLVFLFAVSLPWAPAVVTVSAGAPLADLLPTMALPIAVFTTTIVAHVMRVQRASVIDTLSADFVQAARLRGLPAWRTVLFHVLPSSLPPAISVVAISMASLLGGVVIIERVFNFPGLGTITLQAIHQRDLAVVQGSVVVFTLTYLGLTLLADLAAGLLDPRARPEAS